MSLPIQWYKHDMYNVLIEELFKPIHTVPFLYERIHQDGNINLFQ